MVSSLARTLLYVAAAASSTTALGHTKMGYDLVFPALKKLGIQDKGAISARIGWLEVNQGFVILCMYSVSLVAVPLPPP